MSTLIPIACLALPGTAGYATVIAASAARIHTRTIAGPRYDIKIV